MATHRSNDGSSPVGKRGRDHYISSHSGSFSRSPRAHVVSQSPSPRSKRLQRVRETFSKSESTKDSRSRDKYHSEDRDWDKRRDQERGRHVNATRDKDADQTKGRDRSQGERHTDPNRNGSRREKNREQSPIRRHERSRGDVDTEATRDGSRREKYKELSPVRSYSRRGGRDTDASKGGTVEENHREDFPIRNRDWSQGDRDTEFSRDKADTVTYRDQSPPMRSRPYKFSSPKEIHQKRSRSSPRSNETHSRGHHGNLRNDSLPENDEGYLSTGAHRHRGDGLSRDDSIAQMKAAEAALEAKAKEKEKPSFDYSGKLAAETNKVRGVALQFTEPPEARKPTIRWRLYVFKEGEPLNEPLYIHRQSSYLFGRERRVADIPTDHPSCSKQHAVIQYRS
ncbi:hypothetical protein O6H91_04G022600 [Diphasiastrum complanatum]|uniref:Uncharacterized protein n=1 Tax=Diphasiastrum complanatum TaxID=34168 RepID=A0ACC2DUU5_DIPCM|nr:hypothetical protein O6H91_Y147800 [Diphasiastrum complanatum]KAJ7558031.1 hypothetical protein O6H91_04G022600 [Diphasiastrum complanatum]